MTLASFQVELGCICKLGQVATFWQALLILAVAYLPRS